MNRGACFTQNNVYKWAKHGFATTSPSPKRLSKKWKHTDSGKEKVLSTAISKEGHADSLLRHERTQYFLLSIPNAKFTLKDI